MDRAHDSQSPFDDHEHGSQEYGSVDQPPVVDPVGDVGEHTVQEVHDPRSSHYLDEDPANKAQIQIDPQLSGDAASPGVHASGDSTEDEQPSAEPDERYIVTEQGKLEYIRGPVLQMVMTFPMNTNCGQTLDSSAPMIVTQNSLQALSTPKISHSPYTSRRD